MWNCWLWHRSWYFVKICGCTGLIPSSLSVLSVVRVYMLRILSHRPDSPISISYRGGIFPSLPWELVNIKHNKSSEHKLSHAFELQKSLQLRCHSGLHRLNTKWHSCISVRLVENYLYTFKSITSHNYVRTYEYNMHVRTYEHNIHVLCCTVYVHTYVP